MYLIIIGISVVVCLYLSLMFVISKKINKNKASKGAFIEDTLITKEQKQGVSYGAFLSCYRLEDNPLSLKGKINFIEYEGGLRQQWGIIDHESALQTLDKLAALSVSEELDIFIQQENNRQPKMFLKISKKIKVPIEKIEKSYSTYAWDVCRLSALAKWCFWIGYISEDELTMYLKKCIEIVQVKGSDWEEFAFSFALGRELAGFDLDDIYFEIKTILKQFKQDVRFK